VPDYGRTSCLCSPMECMMGGGSRDFLQDCSVVLYCDAQGHGEHTDRLTDLSIF